MKKYLVAGFLAIGSMITMLGGVKPTVYVQNFNNSGHANDAHMGTIRAAVLEGIQKSGRVEVIDAITESARFEEGMRRLQDNYSDGGDMEKNRELEVLGSNYIVTGDLTNLSFEFTELKNSDGKVSKSYDGKIVFAFKVVDAQDGTTLVAETVSLPKNFFDGLTKTVTKSVAYTEDAAVQNLSGDISNSVKKIVDKNFPLEGTIEDIESVKKDAAETCYITLGSQDGISKKTKLEVKVEQKVGKRTALKPIGELEVESVQGVDISLCKVKKGGKEIKEAFDNEQKIIVVTK